MRKSESWVRNVISAPGKSLSIISKIVSVANMIVGEYMVGTGKWPNLDAVEVIEFSVALALLTLPVDISIILKNLVKAKGGQG